MANLLVVAACALVDRDGRVLLAQRPATKDMGGLWEFPGGKLKPKETPEAALTRELKEELAIDVEAACLAPIGFSSDSLREFHLLLLLYVCRKWSGAPRPVEAEALKWVRPGDFKNFEMPPADRPLAVQLRDYL